MTAIGTFLAALKGVVTNIFMVGSLKLHPLVRTASGQTMYLMNTFFFWTWWNFISFIPFNRVGRRCDTVWHVCDHRVLVILLLLYMGPFTNMQFVEQGRNPSEGVSRRMSSVSIFTLVMTFLEKFQLLLLCINIRPPIPVTITIALESNPWGFQ